MGNIKITLPSADGKVISIEVARRTRHERTCHHLNILVDTDLAEVECSDCHKLLSPVEWIARMAQEWSHVEWLYKTHEKAAELYAEKTRTKCEHCNQITRIRPPSEFDKKIRAVRGF